MSKNELLKKIAIISILSYSTFFCTVVVSWSFCSFVCAEPYQLSYEERKCIENRKKIDRFHIEIEYEMYDAFHPDMKQIAGMTFFCDGDNIRYDIKHKRKVQIKGQDDYYNVIHLWTKDQLVVYTQGLDEAGDNWAVDVKAKDLALKDGYHLPPDVRTIGMNASGFLFPQEIETVVGNLDREKSASTEENFQGLVCKKITYTDTKTGVEYTYWIAPSCGYGIVRMQSYYDGNPRSSNQEKTPPMTNFTEIKLSEHKNSGIWFPAAMKFVCTSGKKVDISQDFKIKTIALNEKIDPNHFTLKGLDIPVGTVVMKGRESIEDNFFWDGNQIQSERGTMLAEAALPEQYRLFRVILIVVGLGLICAACISKYIELRRKRQEKQSD